MEICGTTCTRENIKRGMIIEREGTDNKYLVLRVHQERNSIECWDNKFTDIAIGLQWIHDYHIYDTVDMDYMIEDLKKR